MGWIARRGTERLVNVNNTAQPGEVAVGRTLQVASITAAKSRAQIQVLLAAVKEIGKSGDEGVSVKKPSDRYLQIFAICAGRCRLAAKRRIEGGRGLPCLGPVLGVRIRVQGRLTIPAREAVPQIYASLQLPPESWLIRVDVHN